MRHVSFMTPGRLRSGPRRTPAPYYTPAVLGEDVEGLAGRFGSDHHGLGKLSGDYRADKKTVASFTREGVARDDAHRHLAARRCVEAGRGRAVLPQKQHTRRSWGPITRAGRRTGAGSAGRSPCATTAVRAARGQDLGRAADLIGRDAAPDPAIARVANDTVRDLNDLACGPRDGAEGRCPPGTAERHDQRRDRLAARPPGAVALCCRLHLRGQPGCPPSAHCPPSPLPRRVAGCGRCRTRTPGRTRCPVQRHFR